MKRDLAVIATLLAAVALTLIACWPGLSGPFLFDDSRNLQDLAAAGGVTDWPSFALWAFSGNSGPLGRPLSLASFLLNDYTWPSAAWSFKYTNVLLHAATGLLVFWLLDLIAQRMPETAQARGRAAALAAACVWLIHPIHVATVLFVVQRMTILCTFFMVAGLIAWLKGAQLAERRPVAGSLLMLAGLGGFGLLAILSKETAALLPGYAAVLACTVAPMQMSTPLKRFHWATLLGPLLLAILYVAIRYPDFASAFVIRDFTPAQRVMTEPLVLWSYVRELVAPDLRIGLYYDDLRAARSLFDPLSAGIALLAWTVLVAVAVRWHKREPVASFAILWFVVGHSLEAGPFSLELAFLHRNYLPVIGPMFAAAYYLLALQPARLAWALGGTVAIACAAITWLNAGTWGDEALLVNTWAAQHPGSARSQQAAASFWLKRHDLPRSLDFLDRAIAAEPGSPALRFQRFYLRCINQQPQTEGWAEIVQVLPGALLDTTTSESLQLVSSEIERGNCAEARQDDVRRAASALLTNPRYASPIWRRSLEMVLAETYVLERNLDAAMAHYDAAYAAYPAIQIPRSQAVLLASAGLYADALQYLERERDTPARNFGERIYLDGRVRPAVNEEIEALRSRLAAGAESH
jgi:tetratricopeptide (TPR) repeat protein